RGGVAPAGDPGIGLELQDGVLDRARDVAGAMTAHQAHRDVGHEHGDGGDLDLLQRTAPPLHPAPSIPPTPRPNNGGPTCAAICSAKSSRKASRPSARTSFHAGRPWLS